MDLVFLDTETTGIGPDNEAWEFFGRRRNADGTTADLHMFIDHDERKAQQLPASFYKDYKERYHAPTAQRNRIWQPTGRAAVKIQDFTLDAHIVGAVPSFDADVLSRLLRSQGLEPKWHYHLIDVETLVVGCLTERGETPKLPWKSDEISRAIGVDPGRFARHTAKGDVEWVEAQYDAVMQKKWSTSA